MVKELSTSQKLPHVLGNAQLTVSLANSQLNYWKKCDNLEHTGEQKKKAPNNLAMKTKNINRCELEKSS